MRKLFYILILILPFTAVAQRHYSLYRYNMNVVNPCYAGADPPNIRRAQMEDAPNTITPLLEKTMH